MSFGRKGLEGGAHVPASRGRVMLNGEQLTDPVEDRRTAFLAEERSRRAEVRPASRSQEGISDIAASYQPAYSRSGGERNIWIAYLLWFVIGQFSAHRFYIGATQSAVVQLALFIGSLIIMFIFPPMGLIGFVIWALWLLADLFLIPGLIRKHAQGAPSPLFS